MRKQPTAYPIVIVDKIPCRVIPLEFGEYVLTPDPIDLDRWYDGHFHVDDCADYDADVPREIEVPKSTNSKPMFDSIEDWEKSLGFKVSEAARMAWHASKLTIHREET